MVFEFQFWIWICNGGMVVDVVVGHVEVFDWWVFEARNGPFFTLRVTHFPLWIWTPNSYLYVCVCDRGLKIGDKIKMICCCQNK